MGSRRPLTFHHRKVLHGTKAEGCYDYGCDEETKRCNESKDVARRSEQRPRTCGLKLFNSPFSLQLFTAVFQHSVMSAVNILDNLPIELGASPAGSSDGAIVARDFWIPGTFQRHVEAVVSPTQLTNVMQLRETWLRQNSLPMDYQMRDNVDRAAFIQWAKDQFHSEDDQKKRQLQDYNEGGSKKVKKGKHSRCEPLGTIEDPIGATCSKRQKTTAHRGPPAHRYLDWWDDDDGTANVTASALGPPTEEEYEGESTNKQGDNVTTAVSRTLDAIREEHAERYSDSLGEAESDPSRRAESEQSQVDHTVEFLLSSTAHG